jgi:uncharacterized ferredoxin-like protein
MRRALRVVVVVAACLSAAPARTAPEERPADRVAAVVDAVSEERLAATLRKLAGFSSRPPTPRPAASAPPANGC